MELYEKHKSSRDKFEIFAFHDRSVTDLKDLDEKVKNAVERAWCGKNLPFPTLLDSTGLTYRNFSVRSLGTAVLIDPEGKVVRGTAEEILDEALDAGAGQDGDAPATSPAATAPKSPEAR